MSSSPNHLPLEVGSQKLQIIAGRSTKSFLKDIETPKVEMDELWTIVGEKEFPETTSMTTKEHGSG